MLRRSLLGEMRSDRRQSQKRLEDSLNINLKHEKGAGRGKGRMGGNTLDCCAV